MTEPTFYPNADEVRDHISEDEMSDEELEAFWREAEAYWPSGYYIP